MTGTQRRSKYTREFKLEAVRQVKMGRSVGEVAKVLCMPKPTLMNWVIDSAHGKLSAGVGGSEVTPEQMELARLRAENARLRMERDIAKKAAAYFAQDTLRGTPGSGD